MRSRGKTNARNKNRLIFFMLFLLAAERAGAPTNDRLLDRDAEAADGRITCPHSFFSWRKRSDVLWPQKNNKKKEASWERQTSANFSLDSQTSQIETGTLAREVKLRRQVRAQRGRGFHRVVRFQSEIPVKQLQKEVFKRTGELQLVVFPR